MLSCSFIVLGALLLMLCANFYTFSLMTKTLATSFILDIKAKSLKLGGTERAV